MIWRHKALQADEESRINGLSPTEFQSKDDARTFAYREHKQEYWIHPSHTVAQTTDKQIDGVDLDKRYEDKFSGASTKRPQLQACFDYLRDGDTLHVHSMDRLARSMRDIEDLVMKRTGRSVTIRFHREGWTLSGKMGATQTFLFQMLGTVSQFERSIIRERQAGE